MGYMNTVGWDVFPYDSVVDDESLSDTLGDADSDVKSIWNIFHKNNMDKVIFAHLKINSIQINLISYVIWLKEILMS